MISLYLFIIIIFISTCEASHFTYGTLTWTRTSINTDGTATYAITFESGWAIGSCSGGLAPGASDIYIWAKPTITSYAAQNLGDARGTVMATFPSWCAARKTFTKSLDLRTDWYIGTFNSGGGAWCCRISSILDGNTNNVGVYSYIKSGEASSVGLSSAPRYFFQMGQPITFTIPALSPSGYTLMYALSPTSGTWLSGLALANPQGLLVNSATGQVTWTPPVIATTSSLYAISFKITDIRGQFSYLDVIFEAVPNCGTNPSCNSPPAFTAPITPFDFSTNGVQGYYYYPGTAKSFTLQANDPNTANTVTIRNGPMPAGATFTQIRTGNPCQYTFSWTPSSTSASSIICFIAYDNIGLASTNQFCVNVLISPTLSTATVSQYGAATSPTSGGAVLAITGFRFTTTAGTVTINNIGCTVTSWTDTAISCTVPAGQGTNLPIVVRNTAGATDPNTSPKFAYMRPTITSFTPTNIPTAGTLLTLSGSNFGTLATVSVPGITTSVSSQTHTSLVVNLRAGSGSNLVLTLTVAGQTATTTFSYGAPSITSITPTSVSTSGSQITLYGTNFGTSATISVPRVTTSVSSQTHTTLIANIGVGSGSGIVLTLTINGQTATTTFSYASVTTVGISPSRLPTAGGILTISGSNFISSATVSVQTTTTDTAPSITINSITATSIIVNIGAGQGANFNIIVNVGTTRLTTTFSYVIPVITSFVPSPIKLSTSGGLVTIIGTNFGPSPTVSIRSTTGTASLPLPTFTMVSTTPHTQVVFQVSSGVGSLYYIDINAGTQFAFVSLNYLRPVVSSLSVACIPITNVGTGQLTIMGTDFGNIVSQISLRINSGSSTNLPATTMSVVSAAHTQIVVNYVESSGQNHGLVVRIGDQDALGFLFSYCAPTISGYTPSSLPLSGGLLTISGTNFVIYSGITPFVQQTTSPTVLPAVSMVQSTKNVNQVVVSVGSGSGSDIKLNLNVGGILTNTLFSFASSSISGRNPTTLPTTGGIITITGSSFVGTPTVAVSGGFSISVNSATSTQVFVSIGAGYGSTRTISLTFGNQVVSTTFSYDVPTITGVSPSFIPSTGSLLTVSGSNFGTNGIARFTLSSTSVVLSSYVSHSQIILSIGASSSSSTGTLSIDVGGQTVSTTISFSPATITSVSPSSIPTSGGTITITGTNFGTSGVTSSTVSITSLSHTTIIATVGPGQGSSIPFSLIVRGQTVSSSFNYIAPSISSLSTWIYSGSVLTIMGTNLGTSGGSITVTGGNPNPTLAITSQTSTQIVCTVGNGWGSNLLLTLTVAGQTVTARFTMSPYISTTSVSLTNIATTGGNLVTITGANLCNSVSGDTTVSIKYGIRSSNTDLLASYTSKQYTCTSTTTSSCSLPSTQWVCTLPPSVGQLLTFQVKVGTFYSPESVWTLTHTVPALVSNTIRLNPSDPGSAIIYSSAANGDLLYLDASSIGTDANLQYLTVYYGDCTSSSFICGDVSFFSPTTITCRTSIGGSGNKFKFHIKALNQLSACSTDQYQPPVVPVVSGIYSNVGCIQSGNALVNCPTRGNLLVNITGINFMPAGNSVVTVTVGTSRCIVKSSSNTTITCTLPPGTGEDNIVTVNSDGRSSSSVQLVSYSAPQVDTIRGCTGSGKITTDCSRTMDTTITIFGSNFGARNAVVLVNGQICNNVTHSSDDPHSILTCVIPKLSGLRLPVFLNQDCGSKSNSAWISYISCQPGTKELVGNTTCLDCPIGYYSNVAASLECVQCPLGQYANITGRSQCVSCPVGKIAAQVGSTSCSVCTDGKYNGLQGASECLVCPPGTFTNSSTFYVECQECSVGTYSIGSSSSCSLCNNYMYQDQTGSSSCKVCESGKVGSSILGSDTCTNCPLGKFSFAGDTSCSSCSNSMYQDSIGASTCKTCPIGKVGESNTGSSTCNNCDVGKYGLFDIIPVCVECAAGTYNNNTGLTVCNQCPAGKITNTTGQLSCTECPAGTYSSSTVCISCADGKYASDAGSNACKLCPVGKVYQDGISCSNCLAGTYGDFDATNQKSICTVVPVGFYQNAVGQTTYQPCSSGSIANTTGFTSCSPCGVGTFSYSQGSSCLDCTAGRYQDNIGSSDCKLCSIGTYSNGSATSCTQCIAGQFGAMDANGIPSCFNCAIGSYSLVSGRSVCTICSIGSYNNQSGSTSCTLCNPGQFGAMDVNGIPSCFDCATGTYSLVAGCTVCNMCPLGSYSNVTGQSSCTLCRVGKYGDNQRTSCNMCPVGKVQALQGQSECIDCDSGFYANSTGLTECNKCIAGSFSFLPSHKQQGCALCSLGQYQPSEGQDNCLECEAGTYTGLLGSTVCTKCGITTYQDRTEGSTCFDCNVGRYSMTEGASFCFVCSVGFFNNQTKQSTCNACSLGKYQDDIEQTVCQDCDVGKFASSEQSKFCYDCFPGTYVNETGASACHKCQLGRFTSFYGNISCALCVEGTFMPTEGATSCVSCDVGTYTNVQGQSICSKCSVGQYSNVLGLSQCLQCASGLYSPSEGSTTCLECLEGTYTNGTGQSICKDCRRGSFANAKGLTKCSECLAGTYAQTEGSTICLDCPMGSYNNATGLSFCVQCPLGKYAGSKGQTQCFNCPIGTFSATSGQSSCNICLKGSISAVSGSSACSQCDAGKFQAVDGRGDCGVCLPGTYSLKGQEACSTCDGRTISKTYGSTGCISCDPNAITDSYHTQCICKSGYASKYVPADSPEATNMNIINATINGTSSSVVEICVECPVGANCDLPGNEWGRLQIQPGYWSSDQINFYRCLMGTFCTGTSFESNSTCIAHRTGPLCALCEQGYSETVGGLCQKCSPGGGSMAFFVVIVAFVFGLLCLMYFIVLRSGSQMMEIAKKDEMRKRANSTGLQYGADSKNDDVGEESFDNSWEEETRRYGNKINIHGPPAPKPDFSYKLKIVLGFLQIITNIAIGLEVPWPQYFLTFINWFNPANLDFVQLSGVRCVVSATYYTKMWTFCFIPLVLITGIISAIWLPGYIRSLSHTGDAAVLTRKITRKKAWKLILFTLFLVYPSVSSFILRLYVCKTIDSVSYLVADFSVTCYDSTYNFHAKYASFMIALYPVGVPLFIFFMLWRYRKRLDEPGVRAELGFLYDAYDRKYFYWELVDMINKLFLVSILAFLPQDFQMSGGMIVLVCYIGGLLSCRPYLRKGDDKLQQISMIEILTLLVAGHTFTSYHIYDHKMEILMSVVLIGMFSGFMLLFIVQSLHVIRKMYSKWKKPIKADVHVSDEEQHETELYRPTKPKMSIDNSNNPLFDPSDNRDADETTTGISSVGVNPLIDENKRKFIR